MIAHRQVDRDAQIEELARRHEGGLADSVHHITSVEDELDRRAILLLDPCVQQSEQFAQAVGVARLLDVADAVYRTKVCVREEDEPCHRGPIVVLLNVHDGL